MVALNVKILCLDGFEFSSFCWTTRDENRASGKWALNLLTFLGKGADL